MKMTFWGIITIWEDETGLILPIIVLPCFHWQSFLEVSWMSDYCITERERGRETKDGKHTDSIIALQVKNYSDFMNEAYFRSSRDRKFASTVRHASWTTSNGRIACISDISWIVIPCYSSLKDSMIYRSELIPSSLFSILVTYVLL